MTSFWDDLRTRAEHVVLLMINSIVSLGFIGVFVTVAIWLARRGYDEIPYVLALVYVLASLPIFLVQIGVVLDLLFTVIGIGSIIVPALRSVADRTSIGPVTRVFAGLLTTVSLFSSASTWALRFLLRSASARELIRMKYRTEAGVFAATLARIKNRV